ncbi:DNA-binding NarL/FixJ family response regulator [Streptomyces ambofaciens]
MTTSSNGRVIRVLIADDQQMVRQGFTVLLNTQPDIEVIGQAVDGLDAVAKVAELAPEVVLMDIRMPELGGIEATRRITGATPEIRVLVLTTFDLDEYVYEALRAGASGFLLKDASADQLAEAVRVVAAGDALLAPGITRRLIAEFSPPGRPPARPAQGPRRRADRAGDGGARPHRAGPVERGDRPAPGGRRADGEDARGQDPGEAGPQGPHAGGGVRVRVGAGAPRGVLRSDAGWPP